MPDPARPFEHVSRRCLGIGPRWAYFCMLGVSAAMFVLILLGRTSLAASLSLVQAAFFLGELFRWGPARRRQLRVELEQADYRVCPRCMYALQGLPDGCMCPECGMTATHHERRRTWRERLRGTNAGPRAD